LGFIFFAGFSKFFEAHVREVAITDPIRTDGAAVELGQDRGVDCVDNVLRCGHGITVPGSRFTVQWLKTYEPLNPEPLNL